VFPIRKASGRANGGGRGGRREGRGIDRRILVGDPVWPEPGPLSERSETAAELMIRPTYRALSGCDCTVKCCLSKGPIRWKRPDRPAMGWNFASSPQGDPAAEYGKLTLGLTDAILGIVHRGVLSTKCRVFVRQAAVAFPKVKARGTALKSHGVLPTSRPFHLLNDSFAPPVILLCPKGPLKT